MLQIRPEQMDALGPETDDEISNRLVELLREEFGIVHDSVPEEDLREAISNGLRRARSYSITDSASVASFVALMFTFAPNFDSHPSAQRILTDPTVPRDEAVTMLLRRLTDAEWAEVQQRYDESAWFTTENDPHATEG